jgi:hypothetical protein
MGSFGYFGFLAQISRSFFLLATWLRINFIHQILIIAFQALANVFVFLPDADTTSFLSLTSYLLQYSPRNTEPQGRSSRPAYYIPRR